MKLIRYILAIATVLLFGLLIASAQEAANAAPAAGAPGATLPPFLSHFAGIYGILLCIAGWATHANWPRILAAYEWIGDQGGGWGILRKLAIGKKTVISAICVICGLVSGCNTTHFEATRSDGTKVSIINRRFLWTTDSYVANLTTNGASLTANKSKVDAEAISSITAGVADGLNKALNR